MNDAQKIMAGGLPGDDTTATATAYPPGAPEVVQKALTALPGLVGAIDTAIKEQTGKHIPFVLLVFAEGTALHSANFNPQMAQKAVIELAGRWDADASSALQVGEQEGTLPVDVSMGEGAAVEEPGKVPVINGHGALTQEMIDNGPHAGLGTTPADYEDAASPGQDDGNRDEPDRVTH